MAPPGTASAADRRAGPHRADGRRGHDLGRGARLSRDHDRSRARTPPIPANQRILELFLSNGFAALHHDDQELVVGRIGRISRRQPVVPLTDNDAERFRRFAEPTHLKLAFNFHYRDGVLATETQVYGTDQRAHRLFAVYWFIIRAGSGLIRHVWLRGIGRHTKHLLAAPPRPHTSVGGDDRAGR
jgi:hypothetical protein